MTDGKCHLLYTSHFCFKKRLLFWTYPFSNHFGLLFFKLMRTFCCVFGFVQSEIFGTGTNLLATAWVVPGSMQLLLTWRVPDPDTSSCNLRVDSPQFLKDCQAPPPFAWHWILVLRSVMFFGEKTELIYIISWVSIAHVPQEKKQSRENSSERDEIEDTSNKIKLNLSKNSTGMF